MLEKPRRPSEWLIDEMVLIAKSRASKRWLILKAIGDELGCDRVDCHEESKPNQHRWPVVSANKAWFSRRSLDARVSTHSVLSAGKRLRLFPVFVRFQLCEVIGVGDDDVPA